MKNIIKIKKNSGVAVLLTILIMGVLISIVTALTGIFSTKLKLSAETKYSVGAFYAADSGVDCCIYKHKDPSFICSDISPLSTGATFDTDVTCDTDNVKSVGRFRGVTRAMEISF
jgi:hypothetical protein